MLEAWLDLRCLQFSLTLPFPVLLRIPHQCSHYPAFGSCPFLPPFPHSVSHSLLKLLICWPLLNLDLPPQLPLSLDLFLFPTGHLPRLVHMSPAKYYSSRIPALVTFITSHTYTGLVSISHPSTPTLWSSAVPLPSLRYRAWDLESGWFGLDFQLYHFWLCNRII